MLSKHPNRRTRLPGSLSQLLLLALVWWIISEGAYDAWLIGVPAIALTSVVLARTASSAGFGVRFAALPGFVAYFALQSVRGGADVARRAFTPGLDMRPAILELKWHLPAGTPRTLAAVIMNLLPGTLAVSDDGLSVSVHVIDADAPVAEEIARLERRVSELFGLDPTHWGGTT